MKKAPIIGFYNHWVVLTYLGLIFAVSGILTVISGNIKLAIAFLMLSGICDLFDGAVARKAKRTEVEKNFGIQIDSLADLVSFGILPAVTGYVIFLKSENYSCGKTIFTVIVIAIYVLAALIRLAYFNVIKDEFEKNHKELNFYKGLPVTSVALIIPVVYSICIYLDIAICKIFTPMLLLIAIAFVVNIKVPKLKLKNMIIVCLIALLFILYFLISKGNI